MSTQTLETLRKKFNRKVFGTSTSNVDTDIIDDYLNEAYQEYLMIALPFYRWQINGDILTTSIVADQKEYPLPLDILKIEKLRVDEIELDDDQFEYIDGSLFLLDESLYESDLASGLEITCQSEFTVLVATSDSINIPLAHVKYIYKNASSEYCSDFEMWDKYRALKNELAEKKENIEEYYISITNKPIIIESEEEFGY